MLSFAIDNVLLFWGICAAIYGTYQLVRKGKSFEHFLWLCAGIITVVIIVFDHTILIDLIRAGKNGEVYVLKNIGDGLIVIFWLYVLYRDGFFTKL
jgi:hypothetical protein